MHVPRSLFDRGELMFFIGQPLFQREANTPFGKPGPRRLPIDRQALLDRVQPGIGHGRVGNESNDGALSDAANGFLQSEVQVLLDPRFAQLIPVGKHREEQREADIFIEPRHEPDGTRSSGDTPEHWRSPPMLREIRPARGAASPWCRAIRSPTECSVGRSPGRALGVIAPALTVRLLAER